MIDFPIDRDAVARILDAVNAGSPGAEARLLEMVMTELKKIASSRLKNAYDCQSLSPTVLVNEAYLKLFGHSNPTDWNGCGHFFGAAANAMRQIIIDHAKSKRRQKRGGDLVAVDMDVSQLPGLKNATIDELLDLDEALKILAQEDAQLVKLVELKYFVGQTTEDAGKTLGISLATANRHWQYAKARLSQIMKP